jgi:hypothetical protein
MSNGNTNNTVFIQKLFTSRDNFVDGNVQQATANAANYVGQEGRIWWNPDLNGLYYSDGNTPGGFLVGLGGNGVPGGPVNSIQVNDGNGNFSGSANFFVNGNDVDIVGSLYTGNVYANYFIGDGSQLTGIKKIVNGTSYANIETPNGNLEVNVNSYGWIFDSIGNLEVPGSITGNGNSLLDLGFVYGSNTVYLTTTGNDSTALYLDATIAQLYASSNVSISANVGGSANVEWIFDSTGNLTVPANSTISPLSDDLTLDAGGNVYIKSKGHTFLFDSDTVGRLIMPPSGIIAVDDAVGNGLNLFVGNTSTEVGNTWHFGIAGNLTLPDSGLLWNNGGLTTLQAGSDGAQIGSNNGQSYVIANANGAYMQTLADTSNNIWHFGTDGDLTTPGNIIIDNIGDANISSSSNINIISNNKVWDFDTTGNLTLPGNGEIGIKYANGYPYAIANLTGLAAGNNLDIQYNNNGNFAGTDDFTFDSVNVVVTVNGNIVSNNFVANNDYFFSNGDTVLDQVIDYYSNVNTSDIIAGNITVSTTANLGNFTISDQTLAGNITDRPISISPVGNATVKILNGIEVYQGSFTSNPLFSISNTGVVSTLVPNAVSYSGAFEIIGNPDGETVPPQNYGVMLHTTGTQDTPGRIYNDGVNAYGAIINRRYNGTSAAPTGVLANQIIGRIGGTPYIQTVGWPQYSTVRMDFVSTEVQTSTNQGTQAQLWATAQGSNVPLIVAQFNPGTILLTGNLLPNSTISQYGLGNVTNKWSSLYLGPDSLYMEDTVLGTNAELTVANGVLFINGTQKIQIGNMQMTSEGIQHILGAEAQDLTIGTTAGGNTFIRNFGIKFKDNTIQETAAIPLAQKGNALGVVPLNSSTKIDSIYLPAGGLSYQGIWNASNNYPLLADGVGNTGDQWIVGTAGTANLGSGPITFALGDFAILNDSLIWQDVPVGGTGVTSWGVTGNYRAGIVTMVSSDVTTALSSGAITNAKLANSNITINTGFGLGGGGVVNLGSSLSLTTSVGNILPGTGVGVSSSSGNYTISIGQPVGTANSVQFLAVSASTTIQATANISGGNVTTGGQVVATGNVTGSNLKASAQVLATGNIYGSNVIANIGLYSTGDPITGNGALQAGVSGHTITSNTIAQFVGNTSTFAQINFENLNANGSSDYVATADNGTDSTYFIDMGMNGSNFTDPAYTIFAKNDGYLYTVGSSATGPGTAGNLVIGSTSGVVKVFTGNTLTANLRTTTSSTGFAVIGNISATGNITGGNIIGTIAAGANTITTTGNANVGNLGFGSGVIVGTGNITGGNIIGTIAAGSNTVTTTGNITGGNIIGTIAAGSNTITTTGNANVGNLGFGTGVIIGTGNITSGNIIGTIAAGSNTITTTGNITGGNIIGTIAAGANTISTTGNANVGNLGFGTGVIIGTGNITGGNIIGTIAAGSNTITTTGNANVGNLGFGTGVIIGTGNITSGNFIGTFANGNSNVNIPAANGNITLSVAGNANIIVATGTGVNISGYLTVTGNVGSNNVNATNKVVASTLTSNVATGTAPLTVTSTTRVANLNVNYANVSDFEVVTTQTTGTFYPVFVNGNSSANYALGSNSNISFNAATGNLSATLFTGTVTTNAQPNITSLGTLTGLTSGGVVNFTTASNVALGSNANVKITGGGAGNVLTTDGTGNLSWYSPTAGNTVILNGNTTANIDFAINSTTLIYLPTGNVTINLSNYAAGHTARVIIRFATPHTVNMGVANVQQTTEGTLILPITGAGGHKIGSNQSVQLLYTCFDNTAANCYVATTFL